MLVAESGSGLTRQAVAEWSLLSIDIETNSADGDRIFKIGATRSDTEAVVSPSTGRMLPEDVVRRVDAATEEAPHRLCRSALLTELRSSLQTPPSSASLPLYNGGRAIRLGCVVTQTDFSCEEAVRVDSGGSR